MRATLLLDYFNSPPSAEGQPMRRLTRRMHGLSNPNRRTATQRENIYAVIWQDFQTPLSLKFNDSATAVQKAQEMHDKARFAGITLHNLRAVHLDGENKIHTLWQAAL